MRMNQRQQVLAPGANVWLSGIPETLSYSIWKENIVRGVNSMYLDFELEGKSSGKDIFCERRLGPQCRRSRNNSKSEELQLFVMR
jgi:NifB/MoaA-like Fe-S oxidoreductase